MEMFLGLLAAGHSHITLISLALTPATILMCAIVTVLWWKPTKEALFVTHKKDIHWFMIGVLVSFLGSMVDNFYWGLAWLADYYNAPERDNLFKYGVYPNTFFRQGATLVAAMCHIRAATLSDSKRFKALVLGVWGITLGIAATLMLTN